MIVNHNKQFIILQPWKCASGTLFNRLNKYQQSQHGTGQGNYYNEILKKQTCKHIRLDELCLLPEWKLKYKIACFVRNPYDRFYSGYLQSIRDINKNEGFEENISTWGKIVQQGFDIYTEYLYEQCKKGNRIWPVHLQSEYIYYRETNYIDYIGYIESFENDYKTLCDLLDIPYSKDKHSPGYEPMEPCNPFDMSISDYKYVKSKYTDKTIDWVNYIFEKDFRNLNYIMLNK